MFTTTLMMLRLVLPKLNTIVAAAILLLFELMLKAIDLLDAKTLLIILFFSSIHVIHHDDFYL